MIAAVHHPGKQTLDRNLAPLKHTDANTETRNRTEVLVIVILHFATTNGRRNVLGKQLGLANGVLGVRNAVSADAVTRKVRDRRYVTGSPSAFDNLVASCNL